MQLSKVIFITLLILAYPGKTLLAAEIRIFLTSSANDVLEEIIPLLPFQAENKTACYIATAAMGADWAKHAINPVKEAGFNVRLTDLAKLSKDTVEAAFNACDIIFVGGGNTMYLLQEVKRTGFDELVKKKIAQGIPYVGTSAGSIIMAPNIESVKFANDLAAAPLLKSFDGLNMFPYVTFVHISDPKYKAVYQEILNFSLVNDVAFLTLTDKQFIAIEGDSWRMIESE